MRPPLARLNRGSPVNWKKVNRASLWGACLVKYLPHLPCETLGPLNFFLFNWASFVSLGEILPMAVQLCWISLGDEVSSGADFTGEVKSLIS